MDEDINKEYGEMVGLVGQLHAVLSDKKFRSAVHIVLDTLDHASEYFNKVGGYNGMNKCDRVYDRLKRLGKKRTTKQEEAFEMCKKMYEMRASVFSGPDWVSTRPMYKTAKQCATALKRVLVEEEIGVGNVLAYISDDTDTLKKYKAKVAHDYKELNKRVKEFKV